MTREHIRVLSREEEGVTIAIGENDKALELRLMKNGGGGWVIWWRKQGEHRWRERLTIARIEHILTCPKFSILRGKLREIGGREFLHRVVAILGVEAEAMTGKGDIPESYDNFWQSTESPESDASTSGGSIEGLAQGLGLTVEELLRPISVEELLDILSTTIRRDDVTKAITFLAMLSAFTAEDQLNVILKSESSRGKSYIPLELAEYFPEDRILKIAYASPTAFFHEAGIWDEERKAIFVDLEGKILIFLDQPHSELLQRLRPLLSHDQKLLQYKITDRREKKGLRTKTVFIKGYPAVIFCSAKADIEEQERTRTILLSPEASQEKLAEALILLGKRVGNRQAFKEWVESNPKRRFLKARVMAIQASGIREVIIENAEQLARDFIRRKGHLAPRHQRDFSKILSLIKALALLNYAHRERVNESTIKANEEDVEAAFKLYEEVALPNELGLTPEAWEVFREVVQPLLNEDIGVSRSDIQRAYYEKYRRALSDERLRRELIPAWESAGLIRQEPDPQDRRKKLVYPGLKIGERTVG